MREPFYGVGSSIGRALACGASRCEFESRPSPQYATLAQLVEHLPEEQGVPGSIPGGSTKNFLQKGLTFTF